MSHIRWAYIFEAPQTDPARDRLVIDRAGTRSVIVGVPDVMTAIATARELADDGIQFVELCGGFGPLGAARIIEALGPRMPVGAVTFGAESIAGIAAIFAAPTQGAAA